MEIDPNVDGSDLAADGVEGQASGMQSLFQELSSSIPGIDEAMSFAELMKQVNLVVVAMVPALGLCSVLSRL